LRRIALFSLAVLLAGLFLPACSANAPTFNGTVLDPPKPVADFSLTDQNGGTFRLSEQRGHVVMLFFGYTFCPDVCPTTLAKWARVHEALGQEAQDVRFVFVTVDPQRDTPERLGQHMAVFNADFIGLTGPDDELEQVYQDFGVYHEKDTSTASAAGYLVSHTASAFVVDKEGRWRLVHSFDTPSDEIVHDIRQLLRN
jgi:protein SCO1/2